MSAIACNVQHRSLTKARIRILNSEGTFGVSEVLWCAFGGFEELILDLLLMKVILHREQI